MNHDVIVIDGSNLCHRAHAVLRGRELMFDTEPTGLVFNSLRMLNSLCKKLNPSNIIICWDSRTSLREKIYPKYKKQRKEKQLTAQEKRVKEWFYIQLLTFKTFCRQVGIVSFEFEGLEADDGLAIVVENTKELLTLVTTDNDLFQLLSSRVKMYNFKTFYTAKDFKKQYTINPEDWALVKAIAGCDGDGVKGLKGVGIITAIKVILRKKKIPFQELEDIVFTNLPLVELPFKKIKITIPKTKINRDVLFDFCVKYAFKSISERDWLNDF